MEGYYFLRIKKDYASAVIEDLQRMDAVEFLETPTTDVPDWQQKEVTNRLLNLQKDSSRGINWDDAMKRIDEMRK